MIFRKNRPEETQPKEQPEPQQEMPETPQAAAPAAVEAPEAHGEMSVLTADVVMEGNLVTSGDLHLDGTVHGAVQAARVIIDVNGAVNGQVVAQEIIVRGRAIGPICGVRVELAPGAQVQGDVISQSIVVQDGAFIDGQIRHSEDPLGEWQQMWHEAHESEEAHDELAHEGYETAHDTGHFSQPSAEPEQPSGSGHEEEPEEPAAPYLRPASDDDDAVSENSEAQPEETAETAKADDEEKKDSA